MRKGKKGFFLLRPVQLIVIVIKMLLFLTRTDCGPDE